ncbi:hypothetical protein FQN54_008433 [Arachnomyces sp. PD_36]|nr:hypothetical protein FQN54_008433 [Arachnomyces sp. PD_36]
MALNNSFLKEAVGFWPRICNEYPPGLIDVGVALSCQIVGFWIPSTLYLALDLTFPKFSNRHKLQSERRQPSWASIRECILQVFIGNVISTVAHLAFNYFTSNFQYSLFTISPTYPTLWELATDFIYALTLREILFYTFHRALHHPKIYGRIHKQHHKFTAPMAFSAQYAHPVEQILANIMPIVLPLALTHAHILSFALFLTSQLAETSSVHSGYDFAHARKHDLHHSKFRMNYGALGVLDWALGTDIEGWDKPDGGKKKA